MSIDELDLGALRCGFAVVDRHGEEGPCDRVATGWRWYQGHEHEDVLDAACDWHANEGGRRIHAAEAKVARYEADCERLSTLGQEWQARALVAEAKVARVEAVLRIAEYRTATSLGRDFTGRPFESPVPAEDLRRALEDAPDAHSAPETGQQVSGGVVGLEESYVDCTCGHPYDGHIVGVCDYEGCGCGL